MKTLRYIALAALTLSFAACEQDDINPAVQGDPDAVKINATIGNMQTRVAYSGDNGVTNFVNGDAIKVVNLMRTSKNEATYTTTDGTNWTTTDAMVWNSSSKNIFQAWYPVADYSSYDTFTIPTDQSDATKLASADWMTASTGEIDKPGNGVLDLSFQHRLAKVTVNLTFSSQYPEGNQYVSKFTFLTNEETPQLITPLANSETSYTAILRPGEYADESSFIYLEMDGIDEHYVLGKTTTSAINLEAGKHYTFTLKVGKDVVSIDEVTVADWNEEDIDGGVAEEVASPNDISAAEMDAATLNAIVTNALVLGYTDLTVTLKPDAPAEMITAIRRILCSASEDIGMAYPQAIQIVKACVDSALQLGLPEAQLPLAEAAILLATAPKSNSAHDAINAAMADVQKGNTGPVPRQLQNKHFDGDDAEDHDGNDGETIPDDNISQYSNGDDDGADAE